MIHRLALTRLTVSRGERTLFRDLDYGVEAGQIVSLIGPNGAGKTSLIRAVAGLLRPDEGGIDFRDGDDNLLDPAEARGRETHLVGHLDGLKGSRSARDELAFQCDWLGHTQDGVDEAAAAFGLTPLLDLDVRRLSAGQKRRLALARLVGTPRALWLLDEPLGPLDVRWRAVFVDILKRHLAGGGLVVAALHDPMPIETRTLDLAAFA